MKFPSKTYGFVDVFFSGETFDLCEIWWVDKSGCRRGIEALDSSDVAVIYDKIYNMYLRGKKRRPLPKEEQGSV